MLGSMGYGFVLGCLDMERRDHIDFYFCFCHPFHMNFGKQCDKMVRWVSGYGREGMPVGVWSKSLVDTPVLLFFFFGGEHPFLFHSKTGVSDHPILPAPNLNKKQDSKIETTFNGLISSMLLLAPEINTPPLTIRTLNSSLIFPCKN